MLEYEPMGKVYLDSKDGHYLTALEALGRGYTEAELAEARARKERGVS